MKSKVNTPRVKRRFNFTYDRTNYRIVETDPLRVQDVFRFEIWKSGGETPYIVVFQDSMGTLADCTCPGCVHHRMCRHIRLCRDEFLPACSKETPVRHVQLALEGVDEVAVLEARVEELRALYERTKNEKIGLEKTLTEIVKEGLSIKARLDEITKSRNSAA